MPRSARNASTHSIKPAPCAVAGSADAAPDPAAGGTALSTKSFSSEVPDNRAAGVAPIETVYPAFRDLDGLVAAGAVLDLGVDGDVAVLVRHADRLDVAEGAALALLAVAACGDVLDDGDGRHRRRARAALDPDLTKADPKRAGLGDRDDASEPLDGEPVVQPRHSHPLGGRTRHAEGGEEEEPIASGVSSPSRRAPTCASVVARVRRQASPARWP